LGKIILKTSALHIKILRFRRWGRAGYSIFRSICQVVNICRLRISIAKTSMLKLKSNISKIINYLIFNNLENYFEKLNEDGTAFLQNIFQENLIPILNSKNDFFAAKFLCNN
jgi:hypothetical protein